MKTRLRSFLGTGARLTFCMILEFLTKMALALRYFSFKYLPTAGNGASCFQQVLVEQLPQTP